MRYTVALASSSDIATFGDFVITDSRVMPKMSSVFCEQAREVTRREHAGDAVIRRRGDDNATSFGEPHDGVTHRGRRREHGKPVALHDVSHASDELPPKRTAGVNAREVFAPKTFSLQDRDGEGVAKRQLCRRAGGWREIVRDTPPPSPTRRGPRHTRGPASNQRHQSAQSCAHRNDEGVRASVSSSADSPLFESRSATSSAPTRPRSPCRPSTG